ALGVRAEPAEVADQEQEAAGPGDPRQALQRMLRAAARGSRRGTRGRGGRRRPEGLLGDQLEQGQSRAAAEARPALLVRGLREYEAAQPVAVRDRAPGDQGPGLRRPN